MYYINSIIVSIILFVFLGSCNLSAGSYPSAEKYELDYSEEEVKSAIENFKLLSAFVGVLHQQSLEQDSIRLYNTQNDS